MIPGTLWVMCGIGWLLVVILANELRYANARLKIEKDFADDMRKAADESLAREKKIIEESYAREKRLIHQMRSLLPSLAPPPKEKERPN